VLAGKYRVESVLGTGGMGVVVAAEHLQLRRRVALKLLLPEMAQRSDIVARFEREARATACLKNDHVARVLDVGTLENGTPYIVMEYLEGSDLGAMLAGRGTPAPEDAVLYVLQACEALAEAHGMGIIHRDLKPQNLFLTRAVDGAPLVKVLDFGVSRFADTSMDTHLTRTASIVGSPAYMAPEQMRAARNADERSDVWSLGVILYELLTGRLPFEGETMTDLFAKILVTAPKAPTALRPELSPRLSSVVMRCLSVDPARRPSSVTELALAIAPFGTAAARVVSEHVLAVTRATRPSIADASIAAASIAATADESLRAGTAHSVATEAPQRRRLAAVGAGVVLGTVLLGAALMAAARRGRAHSDTMAADSAPTPSPMATPAATASIALVPLEPSSAASAPEPPASTASASARTPAGRATAAKTAPPRPAASGRGKDSPGSAKDDPFQNRNSF
jgi:serine/threonine-protein kinase